MADVTSGLLQLCKLPVIIRKVREPVLILLLENRFKNGGKLRQVAAWTGVYSRSWPLP